MSINEDSSKKKSEWKSFFINAGLTNNVAVLYAKKFVEEEICEVILHRLNEEKLTKLGITKMGHRELILTCIEKEIKKKEETIAGPSSADLDFTDMVSEEETDRRRVFYVRWANSKNVNVMFEEVVRLMKKFCCDRNFIEIDTNNHLVDVLGSFLLRGNLKSNVEWPKLEELNILASIQTCLDQPIKVAQEILKKYKRTALTKDWEKITFFLKMTKYLLRKNRDFF